MVVLLILRVADLVMISGKTLCDVSGPAELMINSGMMAKDMLSLVLHPADEIYVETSERTPTLADKIRDRRCTLPRMRTGCIPLRLVHARRFSRNVLRFVI